jgi:hypothetical protein
MPNFKRGGQFLERKALKYLRLPMKFGFLCGITHTIDDNRCVLFGLRYRAERRPSSHVTSKVGSCVTHVTRNAATYDIEQFNC